MGTIGNPEASSSATLRWLLDTGEDAAVPLTRFLSEDAFRSMVGSVRDGVLMDVLAGRPGVAEEAEAAAGCCGIAVPEAVRHLLPRTLAVGITGFMDADTVDLERLRTCCIQVPTREGRMVPFCGHNLTDRAGRYALRERYRAGAGPDGCIEPPKGQGGVPGGGAPRIPVVP